MSEVAELFIKAEEAPVSLIDQGHSQTALHMLSSHTRIHKLSPSIANMIDHGHRGASEQMAPSRCFSLTLIMVNAGVKAKHC